MSSKAVGTFVQNRPDLLRIPINPSLLNQLSNGMVRVFPVAALLSDLPPSFSSDDVSQLVSQFGLIENVTVCNSESESEFEEEKEDSGEEVKEETNRLCFRVVYRERYNILLLLQNRAQLKVNGTAVSVEPLFVLFFCLTNHFLFGGALDCKCTTIPLNL